MQAIPGQAMKTDDVVVNYIILWITVLDICGVWFSVSLNIAATDTKHS